MNAGFLALALVALVIGVAGRRGGLVMPPEIPRGPGFGGWRVGGGAYRPLDFAMVALLVGMYGIMPLAISAGGDGRGAEPEIGMAVLVANATMQFMLMTLVIAFVAWRRHPAEWLGLSWRPWLLRVPMVAGAGLLATVVVGYFAYALQVSGFEAWLLDRLGTDREAAMQGVVKAFSEAENGGLLVMLCLTAVVVAPVTEEVIFRGYLYPVAKRFGGRGAALAFTSLLFAMVHMNALALLPLALLAVLLALSYEVTGSIWAPVGIHMFFNATTVFGQIAQRYEWIDLPQP